MWRYRSLEPLFSRLNTESAWQPAGQSVGQSVESSFKQSANPTVRLSVLRLPFSRLSHLSLNKSNLDSRKSRASEKTRLQGLCPRKIGPDYATFPGMQFVYCSNATLRATGRTRVELRILAIPQRPVLCELKPNNTEVAIQGTTRIEFRCVEPVGQSHVPRHVRRHLYRYASRHVCRRMYIHVYEKMCRRVCRRTDKYAYRHAYRHVSRHVLISARVLPLVRWRRWLLKD